MADLKIAYVIDFVASLAFYLHITYPGYVCHFTDPSSPLY